MITASGAQVWPDGSRYPQGGVPSIADIAQGLGRMVRFAGQSPVFYTVLPHTFVVADLVAPEHVPYALLHDSPESMIADVPSPWKTDDRRGLEDQLLERIWREHVGTALTLEVRQAVGRADLAAMVAEARLLGLWNLTPAHEDYWGSFPVDDLVEEALELTQRQLLACSSISYLTPSVAVRAFESRWHDAGF